jgi:hypothetical protein
VVDSAGNSAQADGESGGALRSNNPVLPDKDVSYILATLKNSDAEFPGQAVSAAIEKREEIVPELLKIISDTIRDAEELASDPHPSFIPHLSAMYLLAQFREKRAYPLIVDFFSLPGDIPRRLTEDFITEDLARVLASVCGGDISLIKEMIENPGIDEFSRSAAIESLLEMVAAGEMSRDDVMAYFQELFRGKLEREESYVWHSLIECSGSLCPEEVWENILEAYDDELVDSFEIDLEGVESQVDAGKEAAMANLHTVCRGLIDDAVEEMAWLYFPEEEVKLPPVQRDFEERMIPGFYEDSLPEVDEIDNMPIIQKGAKVGRNDPCPCGSGKKYKKCCLGKEQQGASPGFD